MNKKRSRLFSVLIVSILIYAIVFTPFGTIHISAAANTLTDTGTMIGDAHIWKFEAATDIDLSTLKLTYNEGGYTPSISISTSNDENGEWLPLECKDTGNPWGWRYYNYYESKTFLPKGTVYVKVLNVGKIANWGVSDVTPTDFTFDYITYVELGDGQIGFVEDNGVGNVIYKMMPTKDVDLATLKIICNVNELNYGWTPTMYLATTKDSIEWLELGCDMGENPESGWRYYTYSGKQELLPAGNIFIKLGASGSGAADRIGNASYTYSEFGETADKEIRQLRQLSDGSTVFRINPKKPVDLSTFKVTYNEGGWTPKISISNEISGTYEDLVCNDTTNEYGWRYYKYTGEKAYLKAGISYLKVYNSEKIATYGDYSLAPTTFNYDYSAYTVDPIAFRTGEFYLTKATDTTLSFSWPSATSSYCEDNEITYSLYLSTSPIDTAKLSAATWTGADTSYKVTDLPPEMDFYAVVRAADTQTNTVYMSLDNKVSTEKHVFKEHEEGLLILGNGKEDTAYIMNADTEPRHMYYGNQLMREVKASKPLTYKVNFAAPYDKTKIHFYIDGDTSIIAKISSDNKNWIPMTAEREAGGWGNTTFTLPANADLEKLTGNTLYICFEYEGPKKSDYHPDFDAFFINCVLYYTLTEDPKVENSVAVSQGATPVEIVIFDGIDAESGARTDEEYILSNTGTVGNYWSPESAPNGVFIDALQSIVYRVKIPTNSDMSKFYVQDWGTTAAKISVATGDRDTWYTLKKTAGEDWVNRGTWKFKDKYPLVADDGYVYVRISGDGGTLVYTNFYLYYYTYGQEPVNSTGKTTASFTTSTLDEEKRILGDVPATYEDGRRTLNRGGNCVYYFNLPDSTTDFSFDLQDGINTKVYYSRDNSTWGSKEDVPNLINGNENKVIYVKVAGVLDGASWSGFSLDYSYDPYEVNIRIPGSSDDEPEEDDEYNWDDEADDEEKTDSDSTEAVGLSDFGDFGVLGGTRIERLVSELIDFGDFEEEYIEVFDDSDDEDYEDDESVTQRKKVLMRKKKASSGSAGDDIWTYLPYIIAIVAVLLAGGITAFIIIRKKRAKSKINSGGN